MPPRQKTSTTRLPRQLLDELSLSPGTSRNSKGGRKIPGRKERRKIERTERRQGRRPAGRRQLSRDVPSEGSDDEDFDIDDDDTPEPLPPKVPVRSERKKEESSKVEVQPRKSILKKPKPEVIEADKQYMRKAIKDKLEEDDMEIAILEKKLKIKNKRLPNSFIEDGLDFLLDGLESIEEPRGVKRKRTRPPQPERDSDKESDEDNESASDKAMISDEEFCDTGGSDREKEFEAFDEEDGDEEDEKERDEEGNGDDEPEEEEKKADPNERDIYGKLKNAPTPSAGKYIPPSLRKAVAGEGEYLTRLRRQIQGPLNRLSEATLLGIVFEMEQLYRHNPRHHVTSTLTDIILASVCGRSTLLDTFMILHAGLIAALYKITGTDFGAHVTQRIVEEFDKSYTQSKGEDANTIGKECSNLISLLSELYNFQVIGCTLMFDFVRMFLKDITELNTELLLKVVRNCGPQLRSDDPTALKDLVIMMQASVVKAGEANLSVRTKFMIEAITQLKNNRLKAAVANSVVLAEATQRMRKILGSLNSRSIRASEPLAASLDDIRNVETKGKWWLVGASWRDNMAGQPEPTKEKDKRTIKKCQAVDTDTLGESIDYLQLAREQRMNTDVRKAIFVTIMSSEDYKDACERLLKLPLKKAQRTEIPRVLLHCCGSEQLYNPYYALVARHLCPQHGLKMAFQFSLWDLFRMMGEDDGASGGPIEEDEDDELPLRKMVNLAKLYGTLVAEGALSLHILKTINLAYLQSKTRNFLEVFFITVILKSQPEYRSGERNEKAIVEIFRKTNENPELTQGILYFIKKRLRNTDIAGGVAETDLVKWGSRVASDVLKAAAVAQATG